MTVREILENSIKRLRQASIDEPILKSKIIVSDVLGVEKEKLIINEEKVLDKNQIESTNKKIEKLMEGYPIQYITNTKEFMGLIFFVNENVLIPQPDTEILVEEVIKISKRIEDVKILDLCTGSGAIAISIAKNIKGKKIVASDISQKALKVANINCKKHNTENIKLIKSDLFEKIDEKFNIIVSNPPYIETKVIESLSKEVQCEPKIALDGGQDGLDFYRKIVNNASKFLEPEGYLCLEIGYDQKEKVINIIKSNNQYRTIYSKKDLENNDRIVICQKKE